MDVTRRNFLRCTAATGVVALAGSDKTQAAGALSDLAAAFTEPPDSAQPWALWFWIPPSPSFSRIR